MKKEYIIQHLLSKNVLRTVVIATIGAFTSSCSEEGVLEIKQDQWKQSLEELDAINTTIKLLNVGETRSASEDYEVKPILRNVYLQSRNTDGHDTIAFVVNRIGQEGGFGVISNSKYAPKVLAFSETGHFSTNLSDNPLVYENFTKYLPDYISYYESGAFDPSDSDIPLQDMKIIEPIVKWKSWSQNGEFAKYVNEVHPGCPAGCVPLACVRAMIYAKDSLFVPTIEPNQKELFYFDRIRQALDDYADYLNPSYNGSLSYYFIQDNYHAAIDRVAKLLFYFGNMIVALYADKNHKTYASISGGRSGMINLGYNCTKFAKYNSKAPYNIVNLLQNKSMLLMSGFDDMAGGHAWVVDGAIYCEKTYPDNIPIETINPITNLYLHCDWGWSGAFNGYYNGDVFELVSSSGDVAYSFENLEYFAVSKD